MTIRDYAMTVDEFDQWVMGAENADKHFEFIAGEIVEVPSNPFVSKIAGLILTFINLYLFEHDIGHVTGEAGGYMVSGDRYAPDVAFISYEKQPELAKSGYNPNPPDLAVEVISSESSRAEEETLTAKLGNYLAVGTMVWIVRPEKGLIEVHQPNIPTTIYRKPDTLTLETVLPGLNIKLGDIFKEIPQSIDEDTAS